VPSVAVATDSTQYLPRAFADSQEIHQVSLYVGWQGEPERELEMDGFDAFYERLRRDPELPTTSQPSIGDFLAVWEPLLEEGREIVSIHLAGGISGTCEAARQAHGLLTERGLGDRVEVIDGESACGGVGLLVLAAAAAARAGADKDAVAARVHETRKALRIWFCLDTLEYLRRGGRVGKAQAWLGGTLKIKPILSLEYEITPVERVRTAGRAFERMVQYAQELYDSGADGWVVQHIQAPEQAQRLIDRCLEIFDSEPVFTSEVGPVIGTYTGPGLIGVGAIPRTLLAGLRAQSRRLRRRRSRPRVSTRPTTTAPPIFSSRWWRAMCPRQSAKCVTSPRSLTSETASSSRLASIELRISVAERCAIRASPRSSRACPRRRTRSRGSSAPLRSPCSAPAAILF